MSTDMQRGFVQNAASLPKGGISPLQLLPTGGLHVQTVNPKYMEFARGQRLYAASTGAGTAIAPVNALPTTTAAWALYNGDTGKHLVVLKITAHSVSGTLGLGMSLLAGISSAAQASAPSAYSSSVHKAITPGSADTNGVFAQNVTLAGAPIWVNVASRDQLSAASIGSGLVADVEGMFIIPPTYALGMTVLAPAGTSALFNVGVVYATVDLALGL